MKLQSPQCGKDFDLSGQEPALPVCILDQHPGCCRSSTHCLPESSTSPFPPFSFGALKEHIFYCPARTNKVNISRTLRCTVCFMALCSYESQSFYLSNRQVWDLFHMQKCSTNTKLAVEIYVSGHNAIFFSERAAVSNHNIILMGLVSHQ